MNGTGRTGAARPGPARARPGLYLREPAGRR
jgi:hypothetical protein